ncbi:hypothetical protein PAERUG_P63_London_25_VIM_2_03_14_00915 [Pseudomonas aeruginosa]|nr:hypothetical protein PAERUG_P63_London_25_VIM_2_03_14_00915 [Pseudomonas aeruginosa]
MQGIAGLRDIEQGAGQRRGHARPHQQPGQRAERGRAGQAAALAAATETVEAVAQGSRQLQFEEAEHRQREEHEQRGEAAQQPRLLQPGLQVAAKQRRDHPESGVDQRHAQHVATGQQQAATRAGAAADHQPGEDRQHRQRTGSERQQQAEAEEQQQAPGQVAGLQAAGQALVLGDFAARPGGGRAGTAQVERLALRRIAQAGIGAALPAQAQLSGGGRRQGQFQALAIDLRLAEELVAVAFAGRQLRLQGRVESVEAQALLVQVVARRDLPAQLHLAVVEALPGEAEGFLHRQEIRLRRAARREQVVARLRLGQARQQEHQEQDQHTHG